MTQLCEDNFIIEAARNYSNPQCHTIEEFEEDLKRFLYLQKLLNRYKKDGDLRERLILNHIIVLYNLFGNATTDMLFYKTDQEDWEVLAAFLTYINRMPDIDVAPDETVTEVLKRI